MKQPVLKNKQVNPNAPNPNQRRAPSRQIISKTAPTATNWSAAKRAEFCRVVFGDTDVNSMLGFNASDQAKLKLVVRNSGARTAGCKYTLPAKPAKPIPPPRYEAEMTIDCRRGVLHTPEMTKRGMMASKKAKKLQGTDIGMGGTYAHYTVKMGTYMIPIHQINFIHEEPRCSITVRTTYIAEERVHTLAKHVEKRITTDSAPY